MRNHQILISREIINDREYYKFPGGGLEFGEGTIDCLKREIREELEMEILRTTHFYTTDFFQASAFDPPGTQIFCIYYMIETYYNHLIMQLSENEWFKVKEDDHWVSWNKLNSLKISDLTLPIDQKVLYLLQNQFYLDS